MLSFSADQVSGSTPVAGTNKCYLTVALPDGAEGRAIIGPAQAMAATDVERHERVAGCLNFQVKGYGYDAVVEALTSPEGLDLSSF